MSTLNKKEIRTDADKQKNEPFDMAAKIKTHDLNEIIEWVKGQVEIPAQTPHHNPYLSGHNEAIKKVVAHLTSLKEKI